MSHVIGKNFSAESEFVNTFPAVMSLALGAVGEHSGSGDILLALVALLHFRCGHSQLSVLLGMHYHFGTSK